ncbi:MAG TPA: dihydrolipoamide acetyltransferase family protein [Kofleriaceae bacterium]|nr:dihydrolipoamide acetyltransferase family protein [Kofleriaceae bacterium]
MAFEFHLPDIGEGVVEGEIVGWKVKVGDVVALDQPIVEIMTDKATVEIPSPRAGRIAKINYADGQICPVGQVLVVIDEAGGAGATATAAVSATSSGHGNGHGPGAAGTGHHLPSSHEPSPAPQLQLAGHLPEQLSSSAGGAGAGAIPVIDVSEGRSRALATPATRRIARQLGIPLERVPATGKRGRVTTDDVKRFATAPAAARPERSPEPGAGAGAGPARTQAPPIAIARAGEEERIPLRGVRKKIAESMARSKSTAAHFTYVEEIDMTELVAVRERAKARAAERGVKLTYLPFICKAVVSGLKKWPMLNASLDETTQEIVRKKYYHLGIAAQGPQGLAVSVVRDADRRSIFDLSREIDRLGEAVRNGSATREELVGSTFTISSLGKLGGVLATPIINFPEVAILGVHKIEEKPAVRGGQIVIRHLMNLSISVDHRLADGWDGAMFLQDVKSLLEDPTTMFMEMV